MAKTVRFLSSTEFKDKYFGFLVHKKKVKALENLSEADIFEHQNHLALLKSCMETDFLQDEEAVFLDFMLRKYDIDWKYWYHKSPWLKRVMRTRKSKKKELEDRARRQLEFSFTRHVEEQSKKIPLHMLIKTNMKEVRR